MGKVPTAHVGMWVHHLTSECVTWKEEVQGLFCFRIHLSPGTKKI